MADLRFWKALTVAKSWSPHFAVLEDLLVGEKNMMEPVEQLISAASGSSVNI